MGYMAFGLGAYSPAEASRLTGLSVSSLRRWLFGYEYHRDDKMFSQPPLWKPEYGQDQDEPLLGFRDLIEARMVGILRKVGFGMPTIRQCLATASEIAQDEHPFSSAGFRTDGKRIFLERIGSDGHQDLIDLKSKQHAFAKVIERSFLDLDFDAEKATRWFVLSGKRTLVIDPARSFGQPITAEAGIPTYRLAQSVKAEGSIQKVARDFEVPIKVVQDAVVFEAALEGAKPE